MEQKLSRHKDAEKFLEAVGGELYADESVNNLILGITERLLKYPQAYQNPFFASITDQSGDLVCAALMTPPHNLILAGGEQSHEGLPVLISYLEDHQVTIPGVIGPKHMVDEFIKFWTIQGKMPFEITMHQRVYECRSVLIPSLPAGHFRIARQEDIPTITHWLHAFEAEALGETSAPDLERGKRLVQGGYMFLWELKGEIVSMAMKTRPIRHSISIGSVYTPPEHRENGYATAVVAHLTAQLLDSGWQFITLFTDLGNPTSNKIYMKIGYVPVCDFQLARIIQQESY